MDEDERQRKLEAGRAKLASFRQKRAKGDGAGEAKKTQKRKGQDVPKNDGSEQDGRLEPLPRTAANGGRRDGTTSHAQPQRSRKAEVQQSLGQEERPIPQDQVLSLGEELSEEDITTLTGKDQLKQLQQAVEKRNGIIARLSSNLQEALISRDQVQQEAQSLTGKIQGLQRQLQQTSVDFLRFKSQSAVHVPHAQRQQPQPGHSSPDEALLNHTEAPSEELGRAGLCSNTDTETGALPHKLRTELQEERDLNQRICAELREERDNRQLVLSLLEEEKEQRAAERKEREAQLQDLQDLLHRAQAQCLEIQLYKVEKAALNGEVQELRKRLQEEEEVAERRLREEVAKYTLRLQSLEEERGRREEEMQRLKEEHMEELQTVRLLLQEIERQEEEKKEEKKEEEEGEDVEREEIGLKASKNKQNQAKASLGDEEGMSVDEAGLEAGSSENGLNDSVSGDVDPLMERYLSSAHPAHDDPLMERYFSSIQPMHNESLEEHSLLENSAHCSFELNSDVTDDLSHFSISHSLREEPSGFHSISFPQCTPGSRAEADATSSSGQRSPPPWFNNSTSSCREATERCGEESDLGKELLIQQCEDLREELALWEREREVLREEVCKSAEELEEARNRWAQVTEELQDATWELSEEREKRRTCEEELDDEREKRKRAEEEMSVKAHERDNLKNNLSALLEERDEERVPSSPLLPEKATEKLLGELEEVRGDGVVLPSRLTQQEQLVSSLQEMKPCGESVTTEVQALFGKQLQALQVVSELKETNSRHKATAALLGQKTMQLDAALKELDTTREQVAVVQQEMRRLGGEMEEIRGSLGRTEGERSELESHLLCLKQNLTNLEEAQAQGPGEREERRRKEEEMDGRMRKMEQVLEEELEEFEKLIKVKEDELAEEKEKWEEERQEKEEKLFGVRRLLEEQRKESEEEVKALLEKQVQAVEDATEKLRRSHQEEVEELMDKHQEEVSELNTRLETELLEQKASLEEQQKRQISLIKQVTERELQRTVSELCAEQMDKLHLLRTQLSGELRESMEAAHQEELLETRTQQSRDLEALRLGLTNLHTSQLELSQANLQREREAALSEVQVTLRDKWAQDSAVLQARQQFELDRIREQTQEHHEHQRQLHQRDIEELKQRCETRVSQERAVAEEQRVEQIQALRSEWGHEANRSQADNQTSFSETQRSLTETQTDLSESRARLEDLETSGQKEIQRLEEELSQAWADRDAATRAVEELVSSHNAALQEKEQHIRHLEDKEQQLQQELLHLQEEQMSVKLTSEKEMAQLWAQLESMRTSRQELGELKEQLLARSSRVDDIERLKAEFNEQRREIKQQNEAELESLRRYFEQRLRAAEESYREEIALLQLKLVERALEESVLKTGDSSFLSGGEEEKSDALAEITLNLEKHKEELDMLRLQLEQSHTQEMSHLQASMVLSYKEDLLQVRTDLTDRYYEDLQELKTRHALELEQLRARLSDSHVRELTRIRLEAARQVEVEVEQRMWRHSEELQSRTTVIQTLESRLSGLSTQQHAELERNTKQLKREFAEELRARLEEVQKEERERVKGEMSSRSQEEAQRLRAELHGKQEAQLAALRGELQRGMEEERRGLVRDLEEEKEKLSSLQAALDNDESPQVLAVRQRLQAQYDCKLRMAKSCMAAEVKELTALLQQQGEERLHQAQERFQEEKGQLEQHLAQKKEVCLGEVRDEHQAELELQRTKLLANHSKEVDTLCAKHGAQRESLHASHRDQLAATAGELDAKYKAELVALETTLDSKRKAELDTLDAVFQETNLAQLEAQEAELNRKHQEEKDELEMRMLGNMDTLESTYLEEIQNLRDEVVQLEARHGKDVDSQKAAHGKVLECQRAHQLTTVELRKELMEKFSAMATELTHAHKAELSAQKEVLDGEHCKALETLRKQVLELEQQHGSALQELSHTYTTEKEQLNKQYHLQLQELRGISARELQACRRELEEELSRQRLHFLEEVELFKVQSEEKMQDRISHLKAEFEEQKEAGLEEQRRSFAAEHEQKERTYTDKMSQLTAQLQQLDAVVSQLRAEVGCLQGELQGKRVEMDTLDTLLQRRDRESQEGGNLLKMLTDDLQTAKKERRELHQANEKLRKVLLDVVRSTIITEDMIGRKINVGTKISEQTTNQKNSVDNRDTLESGGISVTDVTSDDLELSQTLCESLLVSDTRLKPGGEEAVLTACSRLRQTVDTLLVLLNQANAQLEQTHGVHQSLEARFTQGREDSAQLLQQHKLTLEQLDKEAGLKSQLQVTLHKAEGLLEGYVAEKAVLEEALQQKEAQEERLAEELEGLRVQLDQMEGLRVQLDQMEGFRVQLDQMEGLRAELDSLRVQQEQLGDENTILLRQKDTLTAGLGERERGLLAEAECLAQERLDVQRQAEKDRGDLSQRLRVLETEMEEQETKGQETELHHRAHTEDLNQRVQALEKQLKHNRQFIDEQAVEREHERDEFQQEILRLEAQLRQTARGHTAGDNKGKRIEDLVLQVENLQALIKDKTEDCVSLQAVNQQAQRDVTECNEEIDKLAGRIRELEQALLSTSESNRSVSQLEQELHRVNLREEELVQDKGALEQQQLSNRLQISALQSKLDETRHRYLDNTPDPTEQLRDDLDTAQQNLQSKEHEVGVLMGQLEQVRGDFTIKEAELKHLTLQLELMTNQNAAHVGQLQDQVAALKENVSSLTILQEEREGRAEGEEEEAEEEESLPSALLHEKNEEIDHLSQEIQRLQQEMENTGDNTALEAELDHLRSQVEHLHCDITRLRQDKLEEEERLHEVISTLQAELATLGPARHEVSDSQDGDSVNASPAPSPEPRHHRHRGPPGSLKQELHLTHASSSRSLRSRLEALQALLDTAAAEKEAMERLLFTQEEEYRGHGEELGRRLREERGQAEELRGLLSLKEAELEEVRAKAGELEERERRGEGSTPPRETSTPRRETSTPPRETSTPRRETSTPEKDQLGSLPTELRREEEAREETLKTTEEEIKGEREALRQANVALEKAAAKLGGAERLVAEGRAEVESLETVNGELSTEREALRKREGRLQEEIECLGQEVTSQRARIQELSLQLQGRGTGEEEVLTHAEVTLAKADAALRQREAELARLGAEQRALRAELAAVKEGLSTSTERAEKLLEEGQTKDRALADLETNNQRLKAELRGLQEDLALQEEELAYQQRELLHLRQRCQLQDTPPLHQGHSQKDDSLRGFADRVCSSRDEASLGSPEILRRLECSENGIRGGFHASLLLQGSHFSELSALNSTGLELHQTRTSPGGRMEPPPHSRTITPEPTSHDTHSLGSRISPSDNLSMLDSLDVDQVCELEALELTAPSSPLGSNSSLSAPEWASDGYGSNVSSELGVRLRVELEQTERLDAQFVEYLHCRGMNPTANTDSAAGSMSYSDELPCPELQDLLKRVYQESCRVLTLSQRHVAPSSQSHSKAFSRDQTLCHSDRIAIQLDQTDEPPSSPPMGWQQEKRALQETVIALRELLCRMAQRNTQTDNGGDSDLQREPVQFDGQVETRLRAELEESLQQLNSAHDTQQEQKNKLQSLRLAVEECEEALRREQTRVQELQQQMEQETLRREQTRVQELQEQETLRGEQTRVQELQQQEEQETLRREQTRVQELQQQERSLTLRMEREEEERQEAVRVSVEQQGSEVVALRGHLEQERVACSNIRRELQIEHSRSLLLETRLDDTHRDLEEAQQLSARQKDLQAQERSRQEHFLKEAESCLADAHRKLEEERQLSARQKDLQAQERSGQEHFLKEAESGLADAHRNLEEARQLSAQQKDLQAQERSRQEHLLEEAESRLVNVHRKLEEEGDRCSRQLDDITRRQEADTARDGKFIADMRSQLEQERRQGEELVAMTDRLRADLLLSRRSEEEEERRRREESQREQVATARLRVSAESLKEQRLEADRALEAERERSAHHGAELKELTEKLRLLKDKEREREEQRERERRKERQEQTERERRHERTNNKLVDLELLRKQDQQHMRELQQTLEMAAQRLPGSAGGPLYQGLSGSAGGPLYQGLSGSAGAPPHQGLSGSAGAPPHQGLSRSPGGPPHQAPAVQADTAQDGLAPQNHQSSSSFSSSSSSALLVERLLKENSELTERVTALSQERVTHKRTLACLERHLRHAEDELTKVTAEIENRPVNDVSHGKVQRLYERYLRAESFRKSLVYQKRYLLLLLGGFHDCEQATLCLIARMGAHPSPPLILHRPLARFRAAVCVVIAISRLKFLTRKWQKNIRRVSASTTVNGHASGARTEVLRQQHPRSNSASLPPTRDSSPAHRDTVSTLVPPIKSPFRLHNRRYSSTTVVSGLSDGTSQDPERSLTDYIQHLEKVQQRLAGTRPGSSVSLTHPKKSDH